MKNLIFKAFIPFELVNGNDGQRKNWQSTAKARKRYQQTMQLLRMGREPFDFPVVVHVVRMLKPGQSLWDSSSCGRGNWKQLEDALVAMGWFTDDSPKYIKETRFFQDQHHRKTRNAGEIFIAVFRHEGEESKYANIDNY